MSRSITFRHGPFQGWSLDLFTTYTDGHLTRALVQIATPHPYRPEQPTSLDGVVALTADSADSDGFYKATAAENGGPADMAELLNWVVEATRAALDRRTDVPPEQRTHWQTIVDRADETRADFFARYRDGIVPPFEIVGGNAAGHALAAVGAR